MRKAKGGGGGTAPGASEATIVIKPWDPGQPYLRALRAAGPAEAYQVFLAQRKQHGRSPAFFLDCADFFLSAGQRALAVRVLTDVVELQLAEPRLLRIAAHRLEQIGELDLAVTLFEAVLKLRPEEPQSLRDLALAIGLRADARRQQAGHGTKAIAAEYRRALELLDRVVMGEWDGRFPEIEVIALEEANRMIAILRRDPGFGPVELPIDARLRTPLELDLRVVLTWDTDLTDMDLWVVEPSGEKCYYSHALTTIGGAITRDFTQGYGPEEYARATRAGGRLQGAGQLLRIALAEPDRPDDRAGDGDHGLRPTGREAAEPHASADRGEGHRRRGRGAGRAGADTDQPVACQASARHELVLARPRLRGLASCPARRDVERREGVDRLLRLRTHRG